jgi:5-methylcytosine-specific restriction endonuclease McrA
MTTTFTDTWDEIRARVLARDEHRCTVSRLLGGECRGRLHVHHIEPRSEGGTDDEDNLATVCARHHAIWERLRQRVLYARPTAWKRCRHEHRTRESREECERRLNRAA